jgi:hypothetical protein
MSRPRPQYPACQCSSHGPEIAFLDFLIAIGLGDVPRVKLTRETILQAMRTCGEAYYVNLAQAEIPKDVAA